MTDGEEAGESETVLGEAKESYPWLLEADEFELVWLIVSEIY